MKRLRWNGMNETVFNQTAFDETAFDVTAFDETAFQETLFDETPFNEVCGSSWNYPWCLITSFEISYGINRKGRSRVFYSIKWWVLTLKIQSYFCCVRIEKCWLLKIRVFTKKSLQFDGIYAENWKKKEEMKKDQHTFFFSFLSHVKLCQLFTSVYRHSLFLFVFILLEVSHGLKNILQEGSEFQQARVRSNMLMSLWNFCMPVRPYTENCIR